MDNFSKLKNQITIRVLVGVVFVALAALSTWWLCFTYAKLDENTSFIAAGTMALIVGVAVSVILAESVLRPLQLLSAAIVSADPDHHGSQAPNLDSLHLGRELVTTLALQVYQLASNTQGATNLTEHRKELSQAANVVSRLPLPLFVFNKDLLVTNASDSALEYCQVESSALFGKPLFDSLDMEFPSELTLEKWINDSKDTKVTNTGYWERVRVHSKKDGSIRQCDLYAYYNRENTSGAEYIVTLFDRTEQYNQDDEAMSFVSLAVHELRTPLTTLRGYIEVFEEELGPTLNAELKDFMLKMEASANQLTSFVHNILNVARIDNNQLSLHLVEDNWPEVLKTGAANMELRAGIFKTAIEYDIAPDLPTVAVDPITIGEVVNNLLDNAIKYSPGEGKKILVKSFLNKAGLIETTVQDFGVGIPSSVLPNMFEKFYRNHRTRAQIGGTGLGLFLSKAIVDAHGGQIWAQSKEGEGSTFGFTLVPYAKLADESKTGNNSDITRQAHGWIKNHSYYRR